MKLITGLAAAAVTGLTVLFLESERELHTFRVKRYLLHLIRMMMSDGKYYAIELHVIAVISRRIDISPLQLISFILDEVNVGHISREEGVTVIDHFVRHFLE